MSRMSFRFSNVVWFGAAAVGLAAVACGGKQLSVGGNGTQMQAVDPGAVNGTVTACGSGSAHPNVCCVAAAGKAASCGNFPGTPFQACGDGYTTYPDPRSCCPLDGNGNCVSPPPPPPPPGGGGGCSIPCPPGWYPTGPNSCCTTDSQGGTLCEGWASAGSTGGGSGGVNPGGPDCPPQSCPACLVDAGPCPPCPPPPPCPTPPPPPPPPDCGVCPPGWQSPQGSPDLCCRTDPDGTIECFSQGVPPGPPPNPGPPPPPPTPVIGCGGNSNGQQCGCQEQSSDGHSYAVNCDNTVGTCSCTVDNSATSHAFPSNNTTCSDATALFAACGFPTQ